MYMYYLEGEGTVYEGVVPVFCEVLGSNLNLVGPVHVFRVGQYINIIVISQYSNNIEFNILHCLEKPNIELNNY